MPPINLLNLSDDILQRIAFFTNRDSYTPFPSFRPHWSNFESRITSKNQKNFFSFRSTCKKLYELCDLKNLQITLHSFEAISTWSNSCPEKVLSSIRRLQIGCKRNDLFSSWCIIIALVQSLTSLEELIINGLPTCSHYNDNASPALSYHLPTHPILPVVKSLCISIRCNQCCAIFTRSMIPATPMLQHLRISISLPLKPSERLQELSDLWCDRNKKSQIPIRTLIIRLVKRSSLSTPIVSEDTEEEFFSVISLVGTLFPGIERFGITTFRSDGKSMVSMCNIALDEPLPTSREARGDSSGPMTFNDRLAALPVFPKLKHLDWGITVRPKSDRPSFLPARIGQTKRVFASQSGNSSPESLRAYLDEYKVTLNQVASELLDKIPNLEGGVFWEVESSGRPDTSNWYRWSWSSVRDESGIKFPNLEEPPVYLSEEFLKNREGEVISLQGSPTRYSDESDDDFGHSVPNDANDGSTEVSKWEEDDTW